MMSPDRKSLLATSVLGLSVTVFCVTNDAKAILNTNVFLQTGRTKELRVQETTIPDAQETCNLALEEIQSRYMDTARVSAALKSDWHLGLIHDLDPTRHYFLEEDYRYFAGLEAELSHDKVDFDFAKSIRTRLLHRIGLAATYADYWVDQPHDFTLNEVVAAEYATFAQSEDDLKERWRKRIKRELLGDKLSGLLNEESTETLQKRFRAIFEMLRNIEDQELLSRLLNVFIKRIDPNGSYFSADEFLDFNLRKIPPFQLGLRCELIGEEWEITGVSTFFQEMVDTEHCEKVTGMRLISLTAGNVELVFFRNNRRPWRSLAGGWPDHPKLGDARTVTLELRDPYSRRRMKIEWPRLRIRLNRETDKYESF